MVATSIIVRVAVNPSNKLGFRCDFMEDKTIKDIFIGGLLTLGGCVALYCNNGEIAGTCFGALAGYVLKNGSYYAEKIQG